ncbi:hypothetical protein DFP72DRAFT_610696 [Ephemerocybe angulata]|uniref:Uncharacterized protein n=1 Tax=Ephemerocybe angulata TaxID=980116 RepID=A0A8H6HH18_9AGAR|nr:hypothetical protein DFP72DRAFT_633749 [Tulosesus angulatus]KAF6747280.1 hypothetical protein DFP72DRAFT_610696 [Tulosesus angulatus]
MVEIKKHQNAYLDDETWASGGSQTSFEDHEDRDAFLSNTQPGPIMNTEGEGVDTSLTFVEVIHRKLGYETTESWEAFQSGFVYTTGVLWEKLLVLWGEFLKLSLILAVIVVLLWKMFGEIKEEPMGFWTWWAGVPVKTIKILGSKRQILV